MIIVFLSKLIKIRKGIEVISFIKLFLNYKMLCLIVLFVGFFCDAKEWVFVLLKILFLSCVFKVLYVNKMLID